MYLFDRYEAREKEIKLQLKLSKLLLQNGIDINSKNSEGKTALMLITRIIDIDSFYGKEFLERQMELMQFLLDNGSDINIQDNKGKTALMYAIESKNKKIAEFLLANGADATIKDNFDNTALNYAQDNSVRIIGKLSKNMNIKKQ